MADKKISALTSATTPLAGTEVLPIVQSSTTVKVAVNDLTVQNVRANATTGILQVTGPANASTRIATVPDANFTVARTDAAQSFTGDQTLSTGNLIQGTAAKGINFTANTPAAGKTSTLINWYEEGTWTPVLTATTPGDLVVAYTTQLGFYTRVGRLVTISFNIQTSTFTRTTAAGNATITGLPFTSSSTAGSFPIGTLAAQGILKANYTQIGCLPGVNATSMTLPASAPASNQNLGSVAITDMPSGGLIILRGSVSYIV